MFKRFFFLLSRGFRGVWEHRKTHAASLCIVIASLLILGMFSLIGSNGVAILRQMQNQYEITVYVSESVPKDWIFVIGEALEDTDGISEYRFYSKEARMADKEHIAIADVDINAEEYKAMRDSYIIKLRDVQNADAVLEKVRAIDGVEEVQDLQSMAGQLAALTDVLQKGSLWVTFAFAIIALIMIANSIKLGIYARRDEIGIMRYVGATGGFIGFPFVIEGLLVGLLGSVLAALLLLWGYTYFGTKAGEIFTEMTIRPLPFLTVLRQLCLLLLPIGTGIGLFGSLFSVRKYLKK